MVIVFCFVVVVVVVVVVVGHPDLGAAADVVVVVVEAVSDHYCHDRQSSVESVHECVDVQSLSLFHVHLDSLTVIYPSCFCYAPSPPSPSPPSPGSIRFC